MNVGYFFTTDFLGYAPTSGLETVEVRVFNWSIKHYFWKTEHVGHSITRLFHHFADSSNTFFFSATFVLGIKCIYFACKWFACLSCFMLVVLSFRKACNIFHWLRRNSKITEYTRQSESAVLKKMVPMLQLKKQTTAWCCHGTWNLPISVTLKRH